jgi:hypothetical protein
MFVKTNAFTGETEPLCRKTTTESRQKIHKERAARRKGCGANSLNQRREGKNLPRGGNRGSFGRQTQNNLKPQAKKIKTSLACCENWC